MAASHRPDAARPVNRARAVGPQAGRRRRQASMPQSLFSELSLIYVSFSVLALYAPAVLGALALWNRRRARPAWAAPEAEDMATSEHPGASAPA